ACEKFAAVHSVQGGGRRGDIAVSSLAAVGFSARLLLAWFSRGANDAALWEQFGWQISHIGLRSLYDSEPWFTHPPLMVACRFLSVPISTATCLPLSRLPKPPGALGQFA